MKKIIAIMLSVLTLTLVCTGCKPKVDPYEGLYGTYNMVENGTEVYSGGNSLHPDWWPKAIDDYIADIKEKAGKTIEITKDKIKFSGGSVEVELEHNLKGSNIYYDRDLARSLGLNFFMSSVEFVTFKNDTIYQLETHEYPTIDGIEYYIRFFYLK